MGFHWPTLLWLLILIPGLVALYVYAQRRRRKYALRYASLAMVKEALGAGPGIRRHIPPALTLVALAFMLIGVARPYAEVQVPSQEGTVVLAIDVSGSMQATDVLPNRMEVAKAAAKSFVAKQSDNVRIGVVSFSSDASIVQSPTTDKVLVIEAIDRLRPQRATAIGRGILVSLDSIFEGSEDEPPSQKWLRPDLQPAPGEAQPPAPSAQARAIPRAAATIVLLTDGQNNQYPPPLTIVEEASSRGVRVYTIGLGTPEGTILRIGGRSIRTRLDEDTLKRVAALTDAEYYNATNEAELRNVYDNLTLELVLRKEKIEVSALFAGSAALLTVLAASLSLRWFGRIP
jgi:Ca-activated chloride channel family protein